MSNNGAQPFENNWTYLKTELRWLDRLLMLAVSRQRQDDKTLNQVANTPADKATSHWWKGIITVDRGIDDREGPISRSKPKATTTVSYSQHLEDRIQCSYRAGKILALPRLRDRLALTEIEKNILLMAIAPEINRRYGRLYNYLQEDAGALEDLPTVDLCLRLLCRNDNAWQAARSRLTGPNSIVALGLAEWIGDEDGTLLSQQVRVTDKITNFLLSDAPDPALLDSLSPSNGEPATLSRLPDVDVRSSPKRSALNELTAPPENGTDDQPVALFQPVDTAWDHLVLPAKLIRQLQHLGSQAIQRQQEKVAPGLVVLLVGDPGTGKTISAGTIAAALGSSLTCVDLNVLSPDDYPSVLTDIPAEDSALLLVKQGELWFGRKPQVEPTWLHQWWHWRQQHHGLTLVAAHALQTIKPSWRQKFDGILSFTRPDMKARRRLWEQALPAELKTHTIDWGELAKQVPFTGGEIYAIAKTVELDLQARRQKTLTLRALKDAILLHHPHVDTRSIKSSKQ